MDPSSGHHFYVDTKANPPKSIWEHPYDREDVWQHPGDSGAAQRTQQLRPAQAQRTNTSEKQSLGIRIKDKLSMSDGHELSMRIDALVQPELHTRKEKKAVDNATGNN